VGADRVVAAVDDQDRAADLRRQLADAVLVLQARRELGRDECLGIGFQRPTDCVLALLGRVGLVEDLREEELEELLVMLEPVVAVPLLPAFVDVALLDEHLFRSGARRSRRQRQGRRDEHHAGNPLRVVSAEQQRSLRAPRQRHQHRAFGPGRVHHRERILGELLRGIRLRLGRPVRLPVAAWIERQHPSVTGEVRDLRLPRASVDDRPGREEENGRLLLAVKLVEHPHAVALHVPGGVRIARAALLGRPRAA
jgi:hypothetical protein